MNENRAPADPAKRPLTEHHGISPIDDNHRHGRERDQFSMRFAPVVYLAPVVLGGAGIPLGLGLTGSITAIVAGNLLGSLATAACAVMGPRLGIPQVTMGRAAFGHRGNYLPAFLGILLFIGYFSLGTVLGARSLATMTGLPYTPMVLVVAGLSVLIAVFGYDALQAVGQWLTRVSLVVFGAVSVAVLLHGTGPAGVPHPASGHYLTTWLLVCSVIFSYTVSWTIYASDYSRYLPANGHAGSMFRWAFGGIFTSATWMMVLGAALTQLAGGDPLAGLGVVLPTPLLKTVLAVLVIGALSHNAVNLYSGAMAGLTCDLPLRRSTVVVAGGAVGCALSVLLGGSDFQSHFNTFLLMVSYFVMPWLAILLIDFYRTHRAGHDYPEPTAFQDRNGPYRGARPRALLAFLLGIAASVPFMATDAYTGPVGHLLGGVDISYAASFIVTAATYGLLRKPHTAAEPSVLDPALTRHAS
ncbi:cytosine permease [Streptomyces sp. GbtcB6]|uniref:purine-cytosine permease family protein n=1 Tax=Streptomyces sp. GbtcB6 TaxID=2824751 RepID=UPI001C2F13CC|nr:cytosine permease [Streptomyces sp. GbtcB6]